ncbi:BQ2448_5478 [Microbotryum intermedium]|uniref:BQ2448_5478 protein n=1 Tax=Microbotryum intermedium TaxID=269621 RepID=A0A238F495_9BASI|nr:BQ2448_5478 [Microbotryum intermedium]
MDDELRSYIFSQGLLLPPDDYLTALLDPIALELQAPLPTSEAIDEDDLRSIEFWDRRKWDGWMKGIEKEVWEDKLEVKEAVLQRVKGMMAELKKRHWSKMSGLSEVMEDEEDDHVFRFPNRLEDDYLLSRVARRRGVTFESELPTQEIIDKEMVVPPLLDVEDDGDLLRMLEMPEIEDGLDLRLQTTADHVTYLKKMTRSIKAMGRLTREQVLAEPYDADGDGDELPLGLDIDSYRIPSPPLLPRASWKVTDPPRFDLFDEVEVITPPSSPRGCGIPMDAWNREEGIRSLPSSPVRFSRGASLRPIWSSPPTSEQPQVGLEEMEIEKPLFPRAKRGTAATADVEMLPVPIPSLPTSDEDPMREVLARTNTHISELLASDDTFGSDSTASQDLTKLRLRGKRAERMPEHTFILSIWTLGHTVPHLSTPTLPTPPPPPGLEDFASISSSLWSLKVDQGLTSATIGLPWAVDKQIDGQKLHSALLDDDSAQFCDLEEAQERGAALLAETKETDRELAEASLDGTSEVGSKMNQMIDDVFLLPRAPAKVTQPGATVPEPATAQSMASSTNRFTQITAADLDMSKIPPDLIEAVQSTTSSSSPPSRLLSTGLRSSNPASESRSSPPPMQESGAPGRSMVNVDSPDVSGLRYIVASRLGYLQGTSHVQTSTNRSAAFDQFLTTRGQQVSHASPTLTKRIGRCEAKQNPVTTSLPRVGYEAPRTPPYQDTPFPKPQFLQADDETGPLAHIRVVGFHSLFQNRALRSALESANIELVHRYSRWKEHRFRTFDPHLVLDGRTCVLFRSLWSLVGRAYRPGEVEETSAINDLTREEAFFTTLARISHRFDRILVVLTERWPKTSTAVDEYTQPVLKALGELDQGILEHLTGRDDRVRVEVVFSRSPEESCNIVRRLHDDLGKSDQEGSRDATRADPREWLGDPSEDEAILLQIHPINEIIASQILSQCSAAEFFQIDEGTREVRFAGIIGAERLVEVERRIEELRLRQDPGSQVPRADDAASKLTGIAEFEATGSVPSDKSLTSFQELFFDFEA